MYKIDNWWELTLQYRELYLLCGDLNRKEIQKRGIYVYAWLIYYDVQQKLIQHHDATTLQLKNFVFQKVVVRQIPWLWSVSRLSLSSGISRITQTRRLHAQQTLFWLVFISQVDGVNQDGVWATVNLSLSNRLSTQSDQDNKVIKNTSSGVRLTGFLSLTVSSPRSVTEILLHASLHGLSEVQW